MPDDPWLVVEGWVAQRSAPDPRLLMLRRAPTQGGFWQSVSGRVEPEDMNLAAAILRELWEETGITAEGVELVDFAVTQDFIGPVSRRWFRKHVIGVLLPDAFDPQSVRLSEEHVEHRMATLDEAMALVPFTGMRTEIARLAAHLDA